MLHIAAHRGRCRWETIRAEREFGVWRSAVSFSDEEGARVAMYGNVRRPMTCAYCSPPRWKRSSASQAEVFRVPSACGSLPSRRLYNLKCPVPAIGGLRISTERLTQATLGVDDPLLRLCEPLPDRKCSFFQPSGRCTYPRALDSRGDRPRSHCGPAGGVWPCSGASRLSFVAGGARPGAPCLTYRSRSAHPRIQSFAWLPSRYSGRHRFRRPCCRAAQ